ncbi:MAG: YigZ family protein [Sulfurimonas sp.]|nr:YigZ family protein [Sulfurimonas sp.]MDD3059825.1 YigZ family protein [Sulfurimonas sp.]
MKYPSGQFFQTLEVKQSKFIAYLTPYFEYEHLLATLKEKHPKARHFVVAFRYLNEFEQIVEHSSDDGEPKGTSGKPSLMVLQGHELINIAVIIIRYFGGTKLGTGGLVRAYSDAVNLVIQESLFTEYKKEKELHIFVEYGNTRIIEYECEAAAIVIVKKVFSEGVEYFLRSSEENINSFRDKMQRIIKIY